MENYGDGIIEFKCENKEMKVMWLAHLYQVITTLFLEHDGDAPGLIVLSPNSPDESLRLYFLRNI